MSSLAIWRSIHLGFRFHLGLQLFLDSVVTVSSPSISRPGAAFRTVTGAGYPPSDLTAQTLERYEEPRTADRPAAPYTDNYRWMSRIFGNGETVDHSAPLTTDWWDKDRSKIATSTMLKERCKATHRCNRAEHSIHGMQETLYHLAVPPIFVSHLPHVLTTPSMELFVCEPP